MLQCNLGVTAQEAGFVFFVFPLGAAAITPILGNFLDKKGVTVYNILCITIILN